MARLARDERDEDQGRGLADCHHVARHFTVGDRHRATPFDLALEQRDHAASASHDVAEADGPALHRSAVGEHDLLAQPLRAAHDRVTRRRLVGGDEDEPRSARGVRAAQRVPGAGHVGEHGLHGVCLEHRHVLVGRCMEHDLGPLVDEDGQQLVVLDDRDQALAQIDAGGQAQLLRQLEQPALVHVREHEAAWAHRRQEPAQLRANRACSARDQDGPVADLARANLEVDVPLVATHQVVGGQLAQTRGAEPGDPRVGRGDDEHRQLGREADGVELAQHVPVGRAARHKGHALGL